MTKMEINLVRDCLDCIECAEEYLARAKTKKALWEEVGEKEKAAEYARNAALWEHTIEENKNEIKSLL
jgi:hypothetical protein